MRLTLGDDEALTAETVTETLRRVTTEIRNEETEKLTAEEQAHHHTRNELATRRTEESKLQERLYWRCHRRATACAGVVSALMGLVLIAGLATGLGLRSSNQFLGWTLTASSGVLVLMTLVNLAFGSTVADLHQRVQDRCLTWFLTREAEATGVNLQDVN